MPLYINTNINSLNAQRNLSTSQSALSKALQRLSSGLRINSAADDAAGLAIATRFTTQINGLNQSVRNANDGVSLAQTAESALAQVTSNLQRVRTLAVESANGTNSASDRKALNQEVQQRIQEITRVASQTTFNGLHVLNGSFGTTVFQVGANVGDTISVDLSTSVAADQIGQIAEGTSGAQAAALAAGDTITVGDGDAVDLGDFLQTGAQTGQGAGSAYAAAATINNAGIAGLSATADTKVTAAFATIKGNGTASADNSYKLTINGTTVANITDVAATPGLTAKDVAAKINKYTNETGVKATASGGNLTLEADDGRDIAVTQTVGGDVASGTGLAAAAVTTTHGKVSLSASANIKLSATAATHLGFASSTITLGTDTMNSVNVKTVDDANSAIKHVDAALSTISTLRSKLGAIQNRFQSTISNLKAVSQNLSAARSRIQDADFAKETAALTRAQILQSAGISVLAQANATPQVVLKLLQ